MTITITGLRRRTKDVLRALDRNELVSLVYRGKLIGIVTPPSPAPAMTVSDHPFFGSDPSGPPVSKYIDMIRGPRHNI